MIALLGGCGERSSQPPADRGALRVAVLYTAKPALYRSDDGQITGFLYDLEVALGHRLGRPLAFEATSFENVITGVESGRFDIGTGLDATLARQRVIDIVPVYRGGYTVRVLAGARRIGPSLLDLCGLTLGAPAGGAVSRLLASFSQACTRAGRPPLRQLLMPSDAFVLLALQSGRVDGMIAFDWYPSPPGTVLTGPSFATAQSGLAVRKGSPLGPQLVIALQGLIADGSYQRILRRYGVARTALDRVQLNPARD